MVHALIRCLPAPEGYGGRLLVETFAIKVVSYDGASGVATWLLLWPSGALHMASEV